MKLIENIRSKNTPVVGSAAMYYKTEPFVTDISKYTHTNNWEIIRAIEILTSKGFSVDLIDRNNETWRPNRKYDLFLGLGVGNSGRNFARYARSSGARVKVLLSMGPQPDISNNLVLERYRSFQARTGKYAPPMRTVTDVLGDKFLEIMSETDFILNIGELENESFKSYKSYGKKILNFYPAVSPSVSYNPEWETTRSRHKYLCFAGNGLICKGVDVVSEAFLSNPDKELHICGPSEASFFNHYGSLIKGSSNITYHGFIEPGGDAFNALSSRCSFVIFHSSAEGCCTSVATAMRSGLVPVINPWTGINIEGCGISIPDGSDIIASIQRSMDHASSLSNERYQQLVSATLEKSELFSQNSYSESYTRAMDEILKGLR